MSDDNIMFLASIESVEEIELAASELFGESDKQSASNLNSTGSTAESSESKSSLHPAAEHPPAFFGSTSNNNSSSVLPYDDDLDCARERAKWMEEEAAKRNVALLFGDIDTRKAAKRGPKHRLDEAGKS